MGSLNKAILLGTVGQDLILRQTASNLSVTNIRLATNDRKKGANEEWVEVTEWHDVVVFGKRAENCAQYLKKGQQVLVEGKITTREYIDKEGNKRKATEILADNVQFVGSKPSESDSSSTPF